MEVTFKTDDNGAEIVVVVEKGSGITVIKGIEGSFGLYEMQLAPKAGSKIER